MVADVNWHSLGIEQGFLRTMAAVSIWLQVNDFVGMILSYPRFKTDSFRIVRDFGKGMYTLLYLKWLINNVICQSGWERGLGENGYMYMYDRVPLLFT